MHTFFECSRRYVEWLKYGKPTPSRPQTVITAQKVLDLLAKQWIDIEVESITQDHIFELKKELLGRKCKISYVHKILSWVRSFLWYCRAIEHLEVISPDSICLPTRQRQSVEYLTPREIRQTFTAITSDSLWGCRMRAFIALLLDTGLRVNEALSLDRTIDWDNKCVWIVGKGGKKRMIMFRDWSIDLVRQYLELREDSNPALFVSSNNVHSKYWWRWTDHAVRKQFDLLRGETKIDKLRPHTLRRTAATQLWKNGADVKTIQHFLGHSDLKVTERYLGVDYEKVQEKYQKYMFYDVDKCKQMSFNGGKEHIYAYTRKNRKKSRNRQNARGGEVIQSNRSIF